MPKRRKLNFNRRRKGNRKIVAREYVKDVVKGDTSEILEAFTKAYEEEAQMLRALAEEERKKEEEKAQRVANVDYNREVYFEANKLGKVEKLKAYLVTFTNHPHLSYLSFALTADKARAQAQRYMRDTFYAGYSIDSCPISLKETRTKRMKDLDKFKHTGKVPIPELLKTGFRMQCSSCGRFEFDYDDYMARKCFVVEGEGDLTPFTNGYIFCYDCYKKYF